MEWIFNINEFVEISEDQSNGNKQGVFIQSLLWQESQPSSLASSLGRGRGWKSLVLGKREGLRCALNRGYWQGEKMQLEEGILRDWSGDYNLLSLVGPKLEVETKVGGLSVINQGLTVWSGG